jgi:hypothetical protein
MDTTAPGRRAEAASADRFLDDSEHSGVSGAAAVRHRLALGRRAGLDSVRLVDADRDHGSLIGLIGRAWCLPTQPAGCNWPRAQRGVRHGDATRGIGCVSRVGRVHRVHAVCSGDEHRD